MTVRESEWLGTGGMESDGTFARAQLCACEKECDDVACVMCML